MKRFAGAIIFALSLAFFIPASATGQDAFALASWLDVPPHWGRGVLNGLVVATPNDVPQGATMRLLVEPTNESTQSLNKEYEQATRDLGPWTPIGDPINQTFENGWAFRQGVGTVILNDRKFIGNIAVAKRGRWRT